MPTSFAVIQGITIPQQVSTKITQSSSDNRNDPNTSEKNTSQDNSSGVTSHQFQNQKSAILPYLQINRTQRNIPL